MPPVIAAAGAALATAITPSFLATGVLVFNIGQMAVAFVGSLAMSLISRALTPKPKRSGESAQLDNVTVATRQAAATRKQVFGITRVADVYAHITTNDTSNTYMHLFIILAPHEVQEIGEIFCNEESIPPDYLDADGNVTQGPYAGFMRIRKHLGAQTQVADSFAVEELPEWTSNHKLSGIAYLYCRIKYDRDTFPNGEPVFSAVVKGKKIYDPRIDDTVFSTNLVLIARDYLTDTKYGFGAPANVRIDDTVISAEASIADEIVDTDDKDMTVSSVATGTDIITLTGDRLLFQIGDRVEVVTTGSAPGGLATGTDYYVIPYQQKATPRIKLATSLANALAGTAIDITSTGSGTHTIRKTGEPRYHGSGVLDSENTLEDNILSILSGMAGRAVCIGGVWRVLTGAWRAPDISFDENDLRGPISIDTKIPMAERFNEIKGIYIAPFNDYQQADYPPVSDPAFIAEDNGVVYPRELNQQFVTRSDHAQRVAKIELLRARQEIVVKIVTSLRGFQAQVGETVELSIANYGFSNKVFEVTEFALGLSDNEVVCNITLRETASGIYTWSFSDAVAVDPAPNTLLPSPFNVPVVTGVAFNSQVADTGSGDTVYALGLTWDAHPDSFVTSYGDFEIQYKKSADSDWLPSFFVDGSQTAAFVVFSSVNVEYDLRIRARNNLGVRSNWTTIYNAIVGSSGGVGTTDNWQGVADSVSVNKDWQGVADSVTANEDWGNV